MNTSLDSAVADGDTATAEAFKRRLLDWLRGVVAEGWLPAGEIPVLETLEARGAERLFNGEGSRPLTVGLFGGTGVGKSSLLNRLVGEQVAEAGVRRPTSTGVTLYAHEQYPVRDLADELPVDRVQVRTHRREAYRDVVWVDMPDIDSVEERNRALVFEWLPCIDWLIYVVSPEKYRDDAGWRVLRRRGHRHHWLFVINRWDTGTGTQRADFRHLLLEAGVADPVVLRTCCTDPGDDDFDQITAIIDRAVAEHGLAQLQQVGERARLADLADRCQHYAGLLGTLERWERFLRQSRSVVTDRLAGLRRYLCEEAALQAAGVPDRQSEAPPAGHEPAEPALTGDHIRDLEAAVIIQSDGLPTAPIRTRTRAVVESLARRVTEGFLDGFRQGLVNPGNPVQRALARWMGKAVYGLPLLAGAGVAYIVVDRYSAGLSGSGTFLGFEFLVHSLMVLGLAALLPYLLARLLQPSVRRSIVKRVGAAARALNDRVLDEWQEAMTALAARAAALADELETIRTAIEARAGSDNKVDTK